MVFLDSCNGSATIGCFRRRQHDLEPGEFARVRAHTDLSTQGVNAPGDHIHTDAATRVHRYFFLRGEAGPEDQGHGGPGIHAGSFFFGQDLLTHRSSLELVRRDAGAVVLKHELETVSRLAEVHADHANVVLRLGSTNFAGFDAMNGRVAEHLDHAIFDGRDVRGRNFGEAGHLQLELLVVVLRQKLGELETHRQDVVARQLHHLLQLGNHVFERVHAVRDAHQVESRSLALDGMQFAEQAVQLLAELAVRTGGLLQDRIDQLQAGFRGIQERGELQRVDVHHAQHHVELRVRVHQRHLQLLDQQHARGDVTDRAQHVHDAQGAQNAEEDKLQVAGFLAAMTVVHADYKQTQKKKTQHQVLV